jgi:8-amino-7-oxononanoate synthase
VSEPTDFSLADFFFGDGPDPLTPPTDFAEWRKATTWASALYEPSMLAGPVPRTRMQVNGQARAVINLTSYNYLGLARHPETVAAARAALEEYGTGACGSPLLSGMTELHRRLERRLSEFLGREATMLFNSGFGGALGTLAGLLRKNDVAIVDSKVHLSLVDGIGLSKAKLVAFDHNSPAGLEAALEQYRSARKIVVVEGIYSMDGDMADLQRLLPIAKSYEAGVVIDEAHSILGCGAHGRGVSEHFGLDEDVALKYGTFSKAFAAVGGFVSGSAGTIDYLRCYANPYGFSCALPPSVVASILAGLEVATRDQTLRADLWKNGEYFRTQLGHLGVDTGQSTTYVVPLVIGSDRVALYELGHEMRERGLFLAPVDYPSVPQDQVRFRASITAAHTRSDLDEALNIIEDTIVRRLGRRT